ncbi:DUF3857 domain-containing transglutaminase family protein [Pseudoxanthomonas sangjuensis]
MRRWLVMVFALLAAGAAAAGDMEHKRGEFRFSTGAVPAFVKPRPLPAAWDAKAPGATGATWRVWRYDEQVDRRGGRNQVYIDYAYEAKAASLLGSAGRYQITFNPEYQQLAIHGVELRRGGRWLDRLDPERISLARREQDFEEDMADGEVTALIVLEDVRVDDVVRIRYSITGSNPILAGLLTDWTRFGWQTPVLWTGLRVLHDPGTALDVRRQPKAPQADIRNGADAVEVSLQAAHVPAYVDEGAYPIWYQPSPAAYVAKKRQWADVVAWALPLYPQVDELPADLEAELARWAKLPDDDARIKAALRAVQDQVRYFGVEMGDNTHRPTAPAVTWNRRYGDCKDKTYLLVTLLGRMGIRAVPALVSTRRGKAVADMPPAASVFDHVIVRAELDGRKLWLDPTITSEGGDPRDSDQSVYGVALPVAAGAAALEAIAGPGKPGAAIRVSERYEPEADGKVKLSIDTTYEGRSADNARRSFSGTRDDELSRRYAEYYRKRYGDLDVVRAPAISDDRDANRLVVAEQYLLKSPFAADGRTRALEIYAESLAGAAQLPDSIERSGPVNAGMPAHYRHEVSVRLPERWTVSLLDESEDFHSDAFDYERSLAVKDRRIDVVHDLKVLHRDVPADKVATHLAELRKVRDDLSLRLPLQLPAAEQKHERDARLKALLKDIAGDE